MNADSNSALRVPAIYRGALDNTGRGSVADAELTALYLSQTVCGDPLADAAVDALASSAHQETWRFVKAAIEGEEQIARAPEPLRVLFKQLESPPDWLDHDALLEGCRAFHRHSELLTLGFVFDAAVRGFSTMISKSFLMTGRVIDNGVRRLRQNLVQMLEVHMPYSMRVRGDGWKLTVRTRLIHAKVRRLLSDSGDWDAATYGVPISMAHLAFASANFPTRMLDAAVRMGARFSNEERHGLMHCWRYVGWLLGVTEPILYRDEAEARRLAEVGMRCEPPPEEEAIVIANALVNAAPRLSEITSERERKKLLDYGYSLSRALVGNQLADALKFPSCRTFLVLPWFRARAFLATQVGHIPCLGHMFGNARALRLQKLLTVSHLADHGLSYNLPEHVFSDVGPDW